jgi:phosphatidylinositol alpha-1,6-mannosyltransferase
LAQAQLAGDCSWLFYSHLGLSRVQAYIPSLWRRPYGVFIHGIEAWRPLPPVQRQILSGATLRVANSRLTARKVTEANPGVGPILVCPLALPADFDAPGNANGSEVPFALGSKAVVLVARMMASERYKGHDELLTAWPAVRTRVPDARLVFVGDGDDVTRLRARAEELGVADAVIFTGFVPDASLRAIYQRAAVFAMPSAGDGFGLVYLEAMAHRLPCLGSVHDAAGEIIRDGETGFLVDRGDIPTVAERLSVLLADDSRRLQMGQSGYRRWREEFTYEQFARRMVNLIESRLDEAVPRRRAS